jgi:hypothetical protein
MVGEEDADALREASPAWEQGPCKLSSLLFFLTTH